MNLRRALLMAGLGQMLPASLRSADAAPKEQGNAFTLFQSAGSKLAQADQIFDVTTIVPKRAYTAADKAALLRANAAAFPLVRRGLELPYAAPPFRSASQNVPYLRQFRALAHLLTLDGDVRLAHGDAAGAIDRYLDAIQLGQKIEQGGAPVLARLVGIACQTIAQRHVWAAIGSLSAAAARRATHRLQTLFEGQLSYAVNLHEEKAVERALFDEAFQKKDPTLLALVRRYGGELQATAAYDAYLDALVRRAHGRYGVTDRPGAPPPPLDPINDKERDVLWRGRFKVANVEQTQNALLLTTLALRAYRVERGSYPAVLATLSPEYLRKIPDDEFAAHGPLRYRLINANTCLLYSVGPDGTDSGGKPIANPGALTDHQRQLVQPNSVGDIVAGINV